MRPTSSSALALPHPARRRGAGGDASQPVVDWRTPAGRGGGAAAEAAATEAAVVG